MKPMEELKSIISSQKTVSTSRLAPLIEHIEKVTIQQADKLNNQRNRLAELNKRIQIEQSKAERRKELGVENQELREKISRQKRELATLTKALSRS